MNSTVSDQEIERFLAEHVKGLTITPAQLRAHVIRPQNVPVAFSDQGPTGSRLSFPVVRPPIALRYVLDVNTFATALHEQLKDTVEGFCFQIRQQGRPILTRSWQWAKASQDGSEAWTPDVQMHVASVSKLITAMAMTYLFEVNNLSPDAQIINYLPEYWPKGPNIEYICFRNLLNHTSGLTAANRVDFYVMKSAIEAGISLDLHAPEHLGHYNYQNVNYALCRILLAVINGNITASTFGLPFDPDGLWDVVTISAYQQYAVSNLFRQAAVFGATLDHPNAAGLAYRGPMDTNGGWNSGSLQSSCGADGWHLSINELLNVMSAFRRDRSIVAPEFAQQMLDDGFGVDPLVYPVVDGKPFPAGLTTLAGEVYCKNGRWMDAQTATRREEQCLAYFLPNDMELAIFANSRFPVPNIDDLSEPTFRDMVTQTIVDNLTIQLPTFAQ
jgi:hypothetical protein